jgi:1-pyrroline-5-carboxylate dehydrogenase
MEVLKMGSFKLTYATMFNPPEEMHTRFDEAVSFAKAGLGKQHAMLINGKEILAAEKFQDLSPADTNVLLGIFQKGTVRDAEDAIAAARKAFPGWSHTKWEDRVTFVRKAADIIDRRIYEIGAVVAMESGKNRAEALGDVAETADLFRYNCDRMEANQGFVSEMGHDPLSGYRATNISVLRPYGVWVVISPFNFPCALSGGPASAALVAGNTIVMKPATDTPWTTRLIAECLAEAGLPDGVFNYVTGPGSTLGQALIDHPDVDGITFTGSFDVGMKIYRNFSLGRWPRPTVLEMGGKNPVVVTRNANLEEAATGILRSSFGLQGQKCSASSRVYIESQVYEELVNRLTDLTNKLVIGDPVDRNVYLGPVINRKSYLDYQDFIKEINSSGHFLTGGMILQEGKLANGFFCAPTFVVDLPLNHRLWKTEMFLPITTIARINNLDEALNLANAVDYGLTAGFYGSPEEATVFFDKIEAGVAYANRPQGATTGAWPGFQPFGGWKGSGSSGKNAGGLYYLPLYLHEQIHTVIEKA